MGETTAHPPQVGYWKAPKEEEDEDEEEESLPPVPAKSENSIPSGIRPRTSSAISAASQRSGGSVGGSSARGRVNSHVSNHSNPNLPAPQPGTSVNDSDMMEVGYTSLFQRSKRLHPGCEAAQLL